MPGEVRVQMLRDVPQEAVLVLLQRVLPEVPLRPVGNIWAQGGVPLLQQLEDEGGQAKVPLKTFRLF